MAEYFDVDFEDYIIFHRGIRNFYITDENDENPLHLHVVYQDGKDIDLGNPYGNYVAEARQYSEDAIESADAAKRWAIGRKMDDTPVPTTDETYENNSKYYAELLSETAEQVEEYAYGTRNGTAVSGKAEDNVKYYYEEISDIVSDWEDIGSHVHYTGVTSTASDTATKTVVLKDEDGQTTSSFIPKHGTHLFVEFENDNASTNVLLTVHSYIMPVVFSTDSPNYDKLCGICEFEIKKIDNEYVCVFLNSNKYEPVIYTTGALPVAGKLGQLCVVKKESD